MFASTSPTGFALLTILSLLPSCLSLPKPQGNEVHPVLFDANAPIPPPLERLPDFPVPATDLTFRFQDGGSEFTHAEMTCLVEKAETFVTARPAREVIPSASQQPPPTDPYMVLLDGLSFSISNELNDQTFTREVGLVVLNGLKEWLKNAMKTRRFRMNAILILRAGQARPLGVLGFSGPPGLELAVIQ